MPNQNPEQIARDKIDAMLMASGWMAQSKKELNLNAGLGVAIREYQTDVGPADYVLFVNQKPVGIIEAKRKEKKRRFTLASMKINRKDMTHLPIIEQLIRILKTGCLSKMQDSIINLQRSKFSGYI